MAAIEVNQLRVHYEVDGHQHPAVAGVDLAVEPGEILALLGPNGAGKTSTLEVIQGYRRPTSGTVRVFGLDPFDHRGQLAERWGVMPQSGGLPMGLSVAECVRLFASLTPSLQRGPAFERNLLETCGLTPLAEKRWRRLSGGEQQRLSLAVALCGGPDLLLLDEPTSAVDPAGRERILRLMVERRDAGAAVVITTHRFDDIERLADRIAIMHKGQVVATGTPAELTSGRNEVSFTTSAGLPVSELAATVGHDVAEVTPGEYVVSTKASPDVVQAVNAWLAAHGLVAEQVRTGARSLESVFLELTGGEA